MNTLLAFTSADGAASGAVAWAALGWKLAAVFLLVALNGFFVAATYAVEKLRGVDFDDEEQARPGRRWQLARSIVEEPGKYLSATRLGRTACTLAIGVLVIPLAGELFLLLRPLAAQAAWPLAYVLSAGSALMLLIVFGEVVPKAVGVRHAADVLGGMGRLIAFGMVLLRPLRAPLERAGWWILTRVLRVEPVREGEIVHSAEELQVLVEETGERSDVTETEREIVINALELSDLKVRDIMVPRSEVVCLDVESGFEENLATAIESRHTRFPLIRGHMDNTLGLIHIKDLLKLAGQKGASLQGIRRDLLPVPDKMPLDELLQFFLREHAHLALVVDEFGGGLGVAFMDNVLEQLVGDIHDEFDEQEQGFHRLNEGEFFVKGATGLYDLEDESGIELESSDVSTVGGFLTEKLGHVPRSGESVDVEGYRATVTRTDGRRVLQVHFKRLQEETVTANGGGEE